MPKMNPMFLVLSAGLVGAGYFLLKGGASTATTSNPPGGNSSTGTTGNTGSNSGSGNTGGGGTSVTPTPPKAPLISMSTCPILREGNTGTAVRNLQRALTWFASHFNAPHFNPGSVDGQFGTNTKNAVLYMQSYFGVQRTGIVSQASYVRMNQVLANGDGGWSCGGYQQSSSGSSSGSSSNSGSGTSSSGSGAVPPGSTSTGNASWPKYVTPAGNPIYVPRYSFTSCYTLQPGMSGQMIKDWQTALEAFSMLKAYNGASPGAIDGIYGQNTRAATHAFQAYMDITMDGIAGPQTQLNMDYELDHYGGQWKCPSS